MRTRTIWIGVTALAAAGIVWVLATHEPSRPGAGAGDPPGGRKGAVTVPVRPRAPEVRIAGEVLDEAGLPIKGATVYVLDKKRPGADRDKVDHEVTDASGRWRLQTRTTVDTWIGAVAPGYRTGLIDGDGVDASKQIVHVLVRSPALTVTVVDRAGEPLAQAGVQLAPWPPGGTYFCPGPLCRQGEQWAVTDAQGRCTFRQDVAAPVLVSAFLDGYHAHPGSAWLPDAVGETRLAMHPNASFHLALTSGGAPLETADLVTVSFFDATNGNGAAAFTEAVRAGGLVRLERSLVPGTYHVTVDVPGHPGALARDVLVAEGSAAPSRATIDVPPAAGSGRGRLDVRLEGNTTDRRLKGRRRAPLSFLQRTDGAWKTLGWRAGAPERFDASRQRLAYELKPGTYRLLVADVLTGRAAQEREIVVQADATAEVTLKMALGQYGALPAAQADGTYVRSLDAREAGGGRLPVFGSSRDGRQRFSRGIDLIARKVRGEDVVIGPYPLDEFELVLHRSDGTTQTASYR